MDYMYFVMHQGQSVDPASQPIYTYIHIYHHVAGSTASQNTALQPNVDICNKYRVNYSIFDICRTVESKS